MAAGLLILWLTGLGFLWLYWQFEPELLGNPKIWAKVVIVMVLTVVIFIAYSIKIVPEIFGGGA